MAGEYINSNSIEDYWKQLKVIYQNRSLQWKDLTAEQYQAFERSERADSDNHANEERLGKGTQVIDLCYYKYLPDREVAYHIELIHQDSRKKDLYFQLKLKTEIE